MSAEFKPLIFDCDNVTVKFDNFNSTIIDRTNKNFKEKLLPVDKKLESKIIEIPAADSTKIMTYGYIDYLTFAYENHLSIEVAPWHLWTVVLVEISNIINKDPETYKKYFTTSEKREEIVFKMKGTLIENLNEFLVEVRKKSPFDIELLRPAFKSADVPQLFDLVCSVSIGEAIKHYYSMMIMGCGFPQIEVFGNVDEWNLVSKISDVIAARFDNEKTNLGNYMQKVSVAFADCSKNLNNEKYWKKFYSVKNCSSGGVVWGYENEATIKQFLYNGWIVSDSLNMARMPFKIDDVWNIIAAGIMQGKLDSRGFLRPVYGVSRYELPTADVEKLPDLESRGNKKK